MQPLAVARYVQKSRASMVRDFQFLSAAAADMEHIGKRVLHGEGKL